MTSAGIDTKQAIHYINQEFNASALPALKEFSKVPNLSPDFDENVLTNGHQDKALEVLYNWVQSRNISGLRTEVYRDENRTPLMLVEVDATNQNKDQTVLMYSHGDKQPPFTGWDEGLDPYKPVIRQGSDGDHYLYARGPADDGYGIFSSILAIEALKQQSIPHSRIVILVEFSEESGSVDLPHYLGKLSDRVGTPDFIICLDSGAGNYETLWTTISLRGILNFEMHISSLTQGVHSGSASGLYADTFRVARMLLSRIENEETGEVKLKELQTEIPDQIRDQLKRTAEELGDKVHSTLPTLQGVQPMHNDHVELLLNRGWRSTVTVTGADDLPHVSKAGSVLRPKTTLKISIRLPPTVSPETAKNAVQKALTQDTPYGFHVELKNLHAASGWSCPPIAGWLSESMNEAAQSYFKGAQGCGYLAEGGSIPFMKMLADNYPRAQFLITGLLGPQSNAHGPNENMNLEYTEKLTCSIAHILARHGKQ